MKKRAIKLLILGAVFAFLPYVLLILCGFAYGFLIALKVIPSSNNPNQMAIAELRLLIPAGIFVAISCLAGFLLLVSGVICYVLSLFTKKPQAKDQTGT